MRRGTLSLLTILVAALITGGCGSRYLVGSPIARENIPKIVMGQTTRADVFRLFGTPFDVESKADQETLRYLYGKESFWTVGFYSERAEKADVLTVYIDPSGIVSGYAFSEDVAIPESYKRRERFPRPPPY